MENNKKTILITIASCREYYLIHTIKSAILSAKYPERVYFSIFNTVVNPNESFLNLPQSERPDVLSLNNVFYTEFHSPTPLGIGYSRMNAALMYNMDHDFVLQVDAHTIFDKNWDQKIIENYYVASKYAGDKIVLSNIPYGFEYDSSDREKIFWQNDKELSFYNFDSDLLNARAAMPSIRTNGIDGNGNFDKALLNIAWVDGGVWNEKHINIDGIDFHEGNCVFAAFMFYPFKYLLDLLHYPKDPFYGDQINFSLRLVSRGFRIFHFYKPIFIALTKTQEETEAKYQWKEACQNHMHAVYLQNQASKHHKEIFNGSYYGYWGAPDGDALKMAKNKMGLEDYLKE